MKTSRQLIQRRLIQPVRIKRIKGFGLIEVLLSTVILGVGLVGVAQFQGTVFQDSSLSKQRTEALKIAEKKLEELRHFSTISGYQTNITSALSGIQSKSTSIINRDTTTYTLKTYVTPDGTGRSADLSVEVTWPDLKDNGNVNSGTTVQLSTSVSNTLPSTLAMTNIVPEPTPPPSEAVPVIERLDPDDTTNLTDTNPEACGCAAAIASIENSSSEDNNFVKVMMKTSTTTTTTTTSTLGTALCDICCDYAIPGTVNAGLDSDILGNEEKYYADFKKKLEAFLVDEANHYQKTSLDDHVIGQSHFDPAYLLKGYQSNTSLYENFLKKTMMGRSGGTSTATRWAICSFIVETVNTVTTTRGCKVWARSP